MDFNCAWISVEVLVELCANFTTFRMVTVKVRFSYATIVTRLGAEKCVPAPLMAHGDATGSYSLARRPRARQTGWFARARVAVR